MNDFISRIKDLFDFNHGCVLLKDRYLAPQSLGTAYCAGVGADVEYERRLDEAGYDVVYIDPSPVGMETRDKLSLYPYYRYGLAGQTGEVDFAQPEDLEERSFRKGLGERFFCHTVGSLMQARGDTSLALLKLNIEGFEYEVLESMIKDNIYPLQICVSYHDHWQGVPSLKTLRSVSMLKKHGYRVAGKKRSAWTFAL